MTTRPTPRSWSPGYVAWKERRNGGPLVRLEPPTPVEGIFEPWTIHEVGRLSSEASRKLYDAATKPE